MKKLELLAPAGNLEKLKIALIYGADAVYIGGESFSLRACADNFTYDKMLEGVEFAHRMNKKVYLTLNIIPHNQDIEEMGKYLIQMSEVGFDAVIVSDPGVYKLVKKYMNTVNIHLSTQANNTNYLSASFWHELGVKRIVMARELSLIEIAEIRKNTPKELELEIFAHGAMCISYSGRCLLSNYMVQRDSNKGFCAHPCRWNYYLMEEKRPNEYFPVYENERGTFIFNSKDLCMIEHIPQIVKSGVDSIKIEGRIKSIFYVATVVKVYRDAIDAFYENGSDFKFEQKWFDEIMKVSNRGYTNGFYFGKPDSQAQVYNTSSYIREYDFVGLVLDYNTDTKIAKIEQRNRLFKGDIIEVLSPKGDFLVQSITEMLDKNGCEIEVAPHPKMILYIKMDKHIQTYSMLRKKAPVKE